MDRKTLRKMIIQECGCMAGDADLPASVAAAFPMMRVLGMDLDSKDDYHDSHEMDDDDDMIEIEMPLNLSVHDDDDDGDDDVEMRHSDRKVKLGDGEEVPEWADKMDEGRRKPWYFKKRRNMKKTENAWYDIKASNGSKKKDSTLEETDTGHVVGKKPPQSTKSKTPLAHPEDEGKSFTGVSGSNDLGASGKPMKNRKLKDLDIYKDHR